MTSRFVGHHELQDIQGNIVRGYRLPHVAHLFGTILPTNVQRWRDSLKALGVTREAAAVKPMETRNVGISHAGMRLLVPHVAQELEVFEAFMSGMPARAPLLGDPADVPWAEWEPRHVWIAVHAIDEPRLVAEVARIQHELRGLLTPSVLVGQALTDRDGHWVEPFGFRDDLSQPAVAGAPNENKLLGGGGKPNAARDGWLPIAAGEFLLGHLNERGRDILSERPAIRSLLANGTFAAFRELVQDVTAFEATVTEAAKSWGVSEQVVKAKLVGRYADGTPLAKASDKSDFTYDDDPHGSRCPVGAHVRRANPRLTGEHRVIRRGMPFWRKNAAGASDDDERGMYLVALNASIERQFEFIQSTWLNNPVGALPGSRDPLVGESSGPKRMAFEGDAAAQRDPILLCLPRFVTCRGGQYYFMPGLDGLQQIADARSAPRAVVSA